MKIRILSLLTLVLIVLLAPASVLAQGYSFLLNSETVNVFWNSDGTESIDYVFVFNNDPSAHAIEYVDVGIPNSNFETSSIYADVNGTPVSDISASGFEGTGSGVAVGLGSHSIPPGQSGTVHVFIGTVREVLRPDSQDKNYASAVFSPAWFETVHGTTNLSVSFHFPPGVKTDEPRWHSAPSGFAPEPTTGIDNQGRIIYTWSYAHADMSQKYDFGASFPRQYVPASAIYQPGLLELLNISSDTLISIMFCGGIGLFILLTGFLGARSSQKRKMQYLPPKIAIEGHGIKRGLTAIEAALLLEEPMDKILTMILFATIKKGASQVTSRDPLNLKVTQPLPEGLLEYEKQFLDAFQAKNKSSQRRELQTMMTDLVKSVSQKMKGFSRRETVAYYRDIMRRAWAQVEAANTPEVKSQKFDEVMEWTMLDRNYDDRTRRVFHGGPVFVPMWWGNFDPGYHPSAPARPAASSQGGGVSLPHLPGSDFAASVVGGVQAVSSSVVGNLTDFTSKITNKTNPIPVSTSSGHSHGGGGGGCACACACAGCACACAGGGR